MTAELLCSPKLRTFQLSQPQIPPCLYQNTYLDEEFTQNSEAQGDAGHHHQHDPQSSFSISTTWYLSSSDQGSHFASIAIHSLYFHITNHASFLSHYLH